MLGGMYLRACTTTCCRLIRKKELQDRHLRPGQAGAGPPPPYHHHQQQRPHQRRRRGDTWRPSERKQGSHAQSPPAHAASWAQPDEGPAQGSRPQQTSGAQPQEQRQLHQIPQPLPLSPPPIGPTGHPGVDRVVRIRQLRLGFREKEREKEREREAQRVRTSSREGRRVRHTFQPSGGTGSGPAVGLGSRGGGEGPAAAAAAAPASEDLIQVTLAEAEGGQQDHREAWGGGGYFWDLGADASGGADTGTGIGSGGSSGNSSSSLLREALMSEAAQMNPVYRWV